MVYLNIVLYAVLVQYNEHYLNTSNVTYTITQRISEDIVPDILYT